MHEAYRCSCGAVWDSLIEAENCPVCVPELVTICDVCERSYFDSDKAVECEKSHNK